MNFFATKQASKTIQLRKYGTLFALDCRAIGCLNLLPTGGIIVNGVVVRHVHCLHRLYFNRDHVDRPDELKGVAERGKETNTRFYFFGALPDPPPFPLPS